MNFLTTCSVILVVVVIGNLYAQDEERCEFNKLLLDFKISFRNKLVLNERLQRSSLVEASKKGESTN